MKQVIAMHGWSGDSQSWRFWAEHFQDNGWTWQSIERGYGHITPYTPTWRKLSSVDCYQRRVVIAHSLGSHLIETELLQQATDVILLASFSRFIPNGIESRLLKTALTSMQKLLGTAEEKTMLNNFLKKACQPESMNAIAAGPITHGLSYEGRKKLEADLELLIQTKNLPKGLSTKTRVLVVQGEEDSIILPSTRNCLIQDLNHHLDQAPTHWLIPKTGHLLMVPELVERVHNWLNSDP